jgi:hypothetical protein
VGYKVEVAPPGPPLLPPLLTLDLLTRLVRTLQSPLRKAPWLIASAHPRGDKRPGVPNATRFCRLCGAVENSMLSARVAPWAMNWIPQPGSPGGVSTLKSGDQNQPRVQAFLIGSPGDQLSFPLFSPSVGQRNHFSKSKRSRRRRLSHSGGQWWHSSPCGVCVCVCVCVCVINHQPQPPLAYPSYKSYLNCTPPNSSARLCIRVGVGREWRKEHLHTA